MKLLLFLVLAVAHGLPAPYKKARARPTETAAEKTMRGRRHLHAGDDLDDVWAAEGPHGKVRAAAPPPAPARSHRTLGERPPWSRPRSAMPTARPPARAGEDGDAGARGRPRNVRCI